MAVSLPHVKSIAHDQLFYTYSILKMIDVPVISSMTMYIYENVSNLQC